MGATQDCGRMTAAARGRFLGPIMLVLASAGAVSGCIGGTPSTPPATGPSAAGPTSPTGGSAAADSASCTEQWRARGHTTQQEAKAFAADCLRQQGAVIQQLDAAATLQIATDLLEANNGITALEPSDIADFCPGYRQQGGEGRAVFWRTMLTAIAKPESDYNTATTFWEVGQKQYSLGLLQLSLSDERAYRCGFETEADITHPDRNLACGVRIMTRLVTRDGVIGGGGGHATAGGAAYWSTLRPASPARARIIGATRALDVCRMP